MATPLQYCSRRINLDKEPGRLQSRGRKELGVTAVTALEGEHIAQVAQPEW